MKRIYLLAPVLMAGSLFGQKAPQGPTNLPEATKSIATEAPRVQDALSTNRAGGDTIWFNGFEEPSEWIASETTDAAQHGWTIGTQTNSWFFTNQDMGTSGNFARMRNATPPPNAPDPAESSYSLTYDGTIDLTDVPAPHLEFEQFGARFIEFQAIQVSVDNGDTWETVADNLDLDPLTDGGGAQYPKPMTRRFNISTAIAADPSNVMIRLFWDGLMNGPAMNYIMYGWYVDNVRIVEGFEDDVAIQSYVSYTDYETTGIFEFGIWPYSQLDELQMAVRATNNGSNDATNIVLDVSVNGEEITATQIPINLDFGTADTVRTVGYTPPAVEGVYSIDFLLSMDADDANPEDNVASQEFQISEFIFARDNDVYSNQFPAATYTSEFQYANGFQFFNEVTVYAIDVLVTAGAIGAGLQGHVLDANLDIVMSTDEIELNAELLNGPPGGNNFAWTTLRLEEPMTMPADAFFAASVESFGGEGVRIGTSKAVPAQTVFVFGDFGTAGFDWYFTGSAGMVRFNLNPDAQTNVQEVVVQENFMLFQNMPNPANASTRIRYSLYENDRVSFEVMDLSGKRVKADDLGVQPMGEHQFDLNISDLAPGMYTYTLTVGNQRATRKMIVQ